MTLLPVLRDVVTERRRNGRIQGMTDTALSDAARAALHVLQLPLEAAR